MTEYGGRMVERLRIEIEQVYGRICWLCRTPILGKISPDHVLPRSKGGTNHIRNLRPSHEECNKRRGDRPWLLLPPPRSAATLPPPSRKW